MDIRLDKAAPEQHPREGWHEFDDGRRLGFVTNQGDSYCLQIFERGQVRPDNYENLAERSRRLAWACFAEMGTPGPSQPKPLAK